MNYPHHLLNRSGKCHRCGQQVLNIKASLYGALKTVQSNQDNTAANHHKTDSGYQQG